MDKNILIIAIANVLIKAMFVGIDFDILPTLKLLGFWVDSGSRHTPLGPWAY